MLHELELPRYRETPAEQVHLTVQFIGDTPVRDLERVIESAERSAKGLSAFALKPVRFIRLPERGRARLLAMETSAPPELKEIQQRAAHRLARKPRNDVGDRFLPHMTMCRFRPPAALHRNVVLPALSELPPFEVEELHLMRSTLQPMGAVHHTVHTVALARE